MEIDFKNYNLDKIKGDVNLFLFENNLTEEMKVTNELVEKLKSAKLIIN